MEKTLLEENVIFFSFPTTVSTPRIIKGRMNCGENSDMRKSMQTLSLFIFSLAFFLGVMGNGLVIWITGFKMKKTVNTVWFLNLSLADFTFTVFLPISIAFTALDYDWRLGKFLCKMNSMVGMLNMYASIFFLVVISVDRLLMVVRPVWSQNHRTPKLASIIAVLTWTLAFIISCPAFVFRDTATQPNNITFCFNNYAFSANRSDPHVRSLIKTSATVLKITSFLCGFLLPFIVIFVCYGVILYRLKRSQQDMRSKPFQVFCAVVLSFFVCWLPFHVFVLLEMGLTDRSCLVKRVFRVGQPVVISIAYLNSFINPIIYVFIVRDFKEMLKTSIQSVLEKAFKEESSIYQSRSTSVLQDDNINMLRQLNDEG